MHGLILAGGEGSRLAAEGIEVPKPLLEVGGEPLILRLLATLARLGCDTLTCMVRADFGQVFQVLAGRSFGPPLRVRACRTPSSLHTLVEGLAAAPPGPVFCSMVDTLMPDADWQTVYAASGGALAQGADLVLAVTPFVDDESPLYVRLGQDGAVQALADEPVEPPCVTGGVYGLSEAARRGAGDARAGGLERMRGFLKWRLAQGVLVRAVMVPRILDIDHAADLRLANAWVASPEAGR